MDHKKIAVTSEVTTPATNAREPLPEKPIMRWVMTTFWIVRKKFSPYVENGK